ncbi:MAG TPA: sigma-70 family RNA polymerase sigma factor [Chitinophaga sp.]|uniref:RNA polymerase sigma factor n=1 Tax=Chitinophaga sp. TaxID=1869181 RepID=UPI002DB8B725|nr:sigma-70 family RNA polymerase sigma factor [Chitinophaga sp.]HEU4555466.1 sigma-70 family RNA polymerase sigma factor [Chitinophaga sp.]
MEDQLWESIRDNDQAAFTSLYKDYYQLLFAEGFRTCGNKDLVKDCIHELFLEIWYNRHKLAPVQHVGAYLKTYLRRKILKEAGKLPQHTTADIETHVIETERPYDELLILLQSRKEVAEKVRRAIQQLSPRQIEIIRMKFFENKSYDEISSLTSTTPRTIYNQVHNSLKILRRYLSILLFFC